MSGNWERSWRAGRSGVLFGIGGVRVRLGWQCAHPPGLPCLFPFFSRGRLITRKGRLGMIDKIAPPPLGAGHADQGHGPPGPPHGPLPPAALLLLGARILHHGPGHDAGHLHAGMNTLEVCRGA